MGREGPLSHPATSEVNVSAKWYIDISFFALTFDCEEIFCSNLVCAYQGCWRDVCDRHWVRFGLDRTEPHQILAPPSSHVLLRAIAQARNYFKQNQARVKLS